MSLQSLFFIFCFLPLFLIAYYSVKDNLKNGLILFGSIAFYYLCSKKALSYCLAIAILTYFLSLFVVWIQERFNNNKIINRATLSISLTVILLPLVYFKYKNFILDEISAITGKDLLINHRDNFIMGVPGISFITFTVISYLFDCYNKTIIPRKNPINLASYILMFPKVLMGPIERYSNYKQYEDHKEVNFNNFSAGLKRFLVGFCKKTIIADNLAAVVAISANSSNLTELPISLLWITSICFSLQIFFDFSGYSDMAIGIAQMLGFKFKENFNYPYMASSITDFWRRWHISLSFWFRDYVYIPLGGSRSSLLKNIFTLFVVWFLTGLWHGASHNFIVWGLVFFIVLLIERYIVKINTRSTATKIIWRICTLLIINLNWVIFSSHSLSKAIETIYAMFGFGANSFYSSLTQRALQDNFVYIVLGLVFCFPIAKWITDKAQNTKYEIPFVVIETFAILFALVWGISFQILGIHHPFLYQQF